MKRGKVRKDLWVKPIVFGVDTPDDVALMLSGDGETWVSIPLSHLERARFWHFWAVQTRRMFEEAGEPWADGLASADLAAVTPTRALRTLAAIDTRQVSIILLTPFDKTFLQMCKDGIPRMNDANALVMYEDGHQSEDQDPTMTFFPDGDHVPTPLYDSLH